MTEHVRYETRGQVALITLDRAAKLNAISTPMSQRLYELLRDLDAGGEARAIVLAAAGRLFCAGADIREYAGHTYAEFVAYQQMNRRVYDLIEAHRLPVIAAVQGPALGGGFELALACDAIIAGEDVYFALPEVDLGLVPGGGGTQRLTRLIGRTRVKELVMTGRRIPAADALSLGIANRLAPPGQALAEALAYAEQIAARPPLAVQWAKRLVNQGAEASLPTALAYEQTALAGLFVTEDGREGIRAFVEKRRPEFRGR